MPTPNPTTRREFKGAAAASNLSVGIAAGDMSFTLVASNNWPTGSVGNFVVAIDRGQPPEEKILCSAQSGHVVTVAASGRGFDGTTAQSHAANATVECVISAFDADEWNQHTNASSGVHGASGTVMGKQLFTAKGDVLVGTASGSTAAVAVGSDTQVLTADSTQASGVKWAAAGGVDPNPWSTYTPAITASPDPTFTAGTVLGRYKILGKTLLLSIYISTGPTSVGTGVYNFPLPPGCTTASNTQMMLCEANIQGNGISICRASIGPGATTFQLLTGDGTTLVSASNYPNFLILSATLEIA